jgi:adenine-specific DNA-methyltransferase
VTESLQVTDKFSPTAKAVVYQGDCREFLDQIPNEAFQLIITSPPYNIGKEYERQIDLDQYVKEQSEVIKRCVRALSPSGSLCWQVGNFVDDGEIIPIDTALFPIFRQLGLKLRNRIVWHFEHGLHCSRRFSGRYEVILWFTKSDDYLFNLDAVRVPQKYPGKKYFKGPRAGQYSCNPLGKNPGDLWIIPNVKSNHVEKTEHPCQFPIELVERLVLALTKPGDWVFDPFLGAGTTVAAAARNHRRGAGCEIVQKYVEISKRRIRQATNGTLPVRPMNTPVFDPKNAGKSLLTAPWKSPQPDAESQALLLLDRSRRSYR